MKTFKKGLLSVTCILTLCTNVQSQVFTVDGNSAWNWDVADRHDTNGTFINDNGMVRTLKAPVIGSVNERNTVRNNFTSAGVPWNEVLATDYFLGNNSAFGLQIANMDAVRNTAAKLASRPATGPGAWNRSVNPISHIWGPVQLENARAGLEDDIQRTYVFKGNWNIGAPIYVGSNKTIWIDGVLTYTGNDTPHVGGAAFTPLGAKVHGVFTVRRKADINVAGRGQLDESDWTSLGQNFAVTNNIVDLNKPLMDSIKSQPIVANVSFFGTQQGKINIPLSTAQSNPQGNWARYAPKLKPRNANGTLGTNGQTIPRIDGIHFSHGWNVVVDGVTMDGALNSIYVSDTYLVDIKNNFIDNSYFRGVHLHASGHAEVNKAFVRNNLITRNRLDGIDIDSHSARYLVEENVVIGSDNRFQIWTEIEAHHNTINNNVGIITLTEASPVGAGGFQENGTETGIVAQGTRFNTWKNNNIFNSTEPKQGFLMRGLESGRVVQHNNTTWTNNYVWQNNRSIGTSNPRIEGIVDDVMFLWLINDGEN